MYRTSLAAAVVAIAAPLTAYAVPVSPGFSESFAKDVMPGGSFQVDFEPTERMQLFFSVSGSGEYEDLFEVSYGFIDGTRYSFDFLSPDRDGPDFAGGYLPSLTTDAPFYVKFLLSDDAADDVGLTLSVDAEAAPAPVPLPAAGFLLGFGMLGLGAVRKLKRA